MWPGLRKWVLSTQNTFVCIMTPISCSVCAIQNLFVLFNSSQNIWWHFRYNNNYKSYTLHFKLSKSGQIIHADKTGFPRPGHIFSFFSLLFLKMWNHIEQSKVVMNWLSNNYLSTCASATRTKDLATVV